MSVRPEDVAPDRAMRAEASAWIAKLHGPERTPELEEDVIAWLRADPRHARAFEHATEVWNALGNLSPGGVTRLAAAESAAFTRVPRAARGSRRWAIAASLLVVMTGAGLWNLLSRGEYTTETGEQRMVTLEDGSRLYLNSDTRLKVALDSVSRSVRLDRGEAYFEVARDPNRPFTVAAGDRIVTALGTSFVVRSDHVATVVTLVEGKISVTTQDENALTLSPGQRLTFRRTEPDEERPTGTAVAPGPRAYTIDTPRIDTLTAWRRGEVVFDETPLAAAIEEMNRYQRQQLVIEDTTVGALPISGIYRTGNNHDFANAMATLYDLEISTSGNEIHLRRAAK
jgi:transmembrane sensor